MESSPSSVRWSELIQAGVLAASQIRVRFSRLARTLCWMRLASRKLGLWDACITVCASCINVTSDTDSFVEWGAEEPGRSQPSLALPLPQSNQPLAMSGTLPAAGINWQCTRSQLEVKLKSTPNLL